MINIIRYYTHHKRNPTDPYISIYLINKFEKLDASCFCFCNCDLLRQYIVRNSVGSDDDSVPSVILLNLIDVASMLVTLNWRCAQATSVT